MAITPILTEIDEFLVPISPESPCGEDLEYDPALGDLERAAVGKPEQQFGSTIIPAEEPDWGEVATKAVELLHRTKDLRVAVHLSRASLMVGGVPSFSKSLELIRGYCERFWETVHPQLDPDDGNDPVLRVNLLESLCDSGTTLRMFRQVPIVSSRLFGRFSLRDVAVADGEVATAGNSSDLPDWTKINGAFADCKLEEISLNAESVNAAIEHVKAIEKAISDEVGAASSVNLEPLLSVLKSAAKVYSVQLAKRGVGSASSEGGAVVNAERSDGVVAVSQRLSGEISSRQDVEMTLDRICDYYNKFEPSSPLPLLLQRCKRLVSSSFLEIIRDIVPEALPQAEAIRGYQEQQSGDD